MADIGGENVTRSADTVAHVGRCPLCAESDARLYHRDRVRTYNRCRRCALVFVPPESWVERAAERARYDQHQNDPTDDRYRRFLARLAGPLLARVTVGTTGLDFGSGPGPALPHMLEAAGLKVRLYDPFYEADKSVWARQYGFIAASEVVEHLRDPATEFERLFAALEPAGWLGVMTKWVGDHENFVTWRYIRDPTHIAFYCPERPCAGSRTGGVQRSSSPLQTSPCFASRGELPDRAT